MLRHHLTPLSLFPCAEMGQDWLMPCGVSAKIKSAEPGSDTEGEGG